MCWAFEESSPRQNWPAPRDTLRVKGSSKSVGRNNTFSEQFKRIFLALWSLLLILETCGDYLKEEIVRHCSLLWKQKKSLFFSDYEWREKPFYLNARFVNKLNTKNETIIDFSPSTEKEGSCNLTHLWAF